jgi:small-conductance mechanosensitive channel
MGHGRFGVVGHVQLSVFGADHAPATLLGSCGRSPGLACQLVWDVSHDGRAATLTSEFLAGPVHLVLRVLFVVLLALIIQALVHRVINRLTERAALSLLPQFRSSMAASRFVPSRAAAGRLVPARLVRRRQRGTAAGSAAAGSEAGDSQAADLEAAYSEAADSQTADSETADLDAADSGTGDSETGDSETGDSETGDSGTGDSAAGQGSASGLAELSSQAAINGAAAQAESAMVDERRKQRVRALGAILRSAASVTIFSIAGFVVLGDLGINLAPLLASAGVVGIAIGFGAQNLVRDYLSGIFMLVEDQYGVGDVITVGDATGTVENVTLRLTRLRDVNGIVWHIRNGTIDQVGNESQGWARAVIDFPVPYEADLATIRSLLAEAADGMWNEPSWRVVMLEAPEVWGAQEITSSEVTMRVVVKTAPLRQWEVEREMRVRVKAALDEAGISSTAKAD